MLLHIKSRAHDHNHARTRRSAVGPHSKYTSTHIPQRVECACAYTDIGHNKRRGGKTPTGSRTRHRGVRKGQEPEDKETVHG
eukprot:scaffold5654_cov119-Isochrysis_galbana.AAC.3